MKLTLVLLVTAAVATTVMISACTQAAPAPAPTQVKAAPAAAAPTAAPAPQPTAAPAVKAVDYPAKGRSISLIVPFAAGGGTDIASRLMASLMEKDLGSPVQVVNKGGAGGQLGFTEIAASKADGYTIGIIAIPHVITSYLDPERKATFTRQSFEPIGQFMVNPVVLTVGADSPFKTAKDLVDAAKASPATVKIGHTGGRSSTELGMLQLQKAAGVQLAPVQFDGGAPQLTALLGGHIDVATNITPEVVGPIAAGQVRVLGVMDKVESKFLPGVKTLDAQGYAVEATSPIGIAAPAGTPKEIATILANSMKKSVATTEWKSKMDELGYTMLSPDPTQYAADWVAAETQVKPLLDLAIQSSQQ
jgi:tripartite-type tricarboxylate transporter receptor subunit TctC